MSARRRPGWRAVVVPALAAVSAATATFAIVSSVTGGDAPERTTRPAATSARSTDGVAAGRAVFARMGCGSCHTLAAADATGDIGPNLDLALGHHDRGSLASKIVDPYPSGGADLFPGMPEDYGRLLSQADLGALVDFLLAARQSARDTPG